jgi:2-phosphosulfolactate phosphatase
MQIKYDTFLAGARAARGLAVIIDVFRAFSCTPLLFSLGIKESILVATPQEAFALKAQAKDVLLIGEISGIPIEGFDLGNSPSEIIRQETSFFKGKTIVQRTSSGVQGALAALDAADEVLVASYNVAAATAHYISSKKPGIVSLVAMGWELKERAPEDECCARYISHLLGAGDYNHNQALGEILFNESAQRFLRADKPHFPAEDPILCLQRDVYNFALRAERHKNLVIVHKIQVTPNRLQKLSIAKRAGEH